MLFGIPAALPAKLLHVLASMGHADELVITDGNFPSASVARGTHVGEVIELTGRSSPEAAKDILSLMPLDAFDDAPAIAMAVPGRQVQSPAVHQEVQSILDGLPGQPWTLSTIERFAFYERAARTFAVVRTLERRPYGCFIFKKGVLTPDGRLMTPELATQLSAGASDQPGSIAV